jgi:hypothetical protein
LNKLASGFRSTNTARSARRPRPSLELLEDRLTPTVFFPPQLGAESPVPGNNGPTLSNTPVHLIFEGSYWQNPTGITEGDVIENVTNILNSSYLSYATQYGTNGKAYLAGSVPDNNLSLTNDTFTEDNLQTVAGNLVKEPYAAPSARGLYFVITAPGVTDATRQVNGYHNELPYYAPLAGDPAFYFQEEIPYGRVDNIMNTRQAQIDHFSQTFGHELVESMTDPYIRTQAANQFHPGASFLPSFPTINDTLDEIADFEPNGGRYTYRVGNGTLVQAYWSQKDQQFVVPDGTEQTFTLTPHWVNRPNQTSGKPPAKVFQNNFDLTVNGDQLSGKDDVYIVQAVTSGPQAGEVSVALNGETAAFDPNQLVSLTLNPLTGDDIVDIESLPAGRAPLTVNLGAGQDTVALGQIGGQLDGLAGAVTVNGGGANSTLRVNDAATGSVNVNGLNLAASHSVDWSVTGNSLSRTDTVVLHAFGQTFTNTFSNKVAYSGLGQINFFGGPCPNTYDLKTDELSTPLAVHGTGANNALTFDDSANTDNAGTAYTLTAGQVTRVGRDVIRFALPSPVHFYYNTATVTYAGVQSLVIKGGLSGNTITVQGTAAGTATTIHAGAGNDLVNVLGTGAGGPLTVDGAGGSDMVRVGSAAAFGGGDAGREGGKLANIRGAVTVLNSAGTATLVLDDSGDPAAYSGVSVASGSLSGLGGAAAITWSGAPTLLYLGGTAGRAGNTVNVDASVSGGLPMIFTGAGNDTFTVFNPSVNNTLTVHGGGSDTFTVNLIDPNAADASYAFDGSTLTRTGHNPDGTVSGVFTLQVDGNADVQVNGAAI